MTTLTITDNILTINVDGIDKLWALKSKLTIPAAHIASVEYNPDIAKTWYHGIKLPGTSLPGVITAGTFYSHGQKIFWDVHNPDNTIVINLRDDSYNQLVIEVENPQVEIERIVKILS